LTGEQNRAGEKRVRTEVPIAGVGGERGGSKELGEGSGRFQPALERAVLVSVEFNAAPRGVREMMTGARKAAVCEEERMQAEGEPPQPIPIHAMQKALLPRRFSQPGLSPEESLEEFRDLVTSAGAMVAAEVVQRRPHPDPATLIGSGKVEEIAGVAASAMADLVLFDHDLSPTQLRNLGDALPCRVLDRTQLILDIFARHARTREGQLQVELAQLEYMLPRLAGRGKSMSQLGGGIGTRGPGETQLETDRRRIQRRIDQLKRDLEGVRRVRRQQRQRREAVPVPTVALVGYTNAGKSTLFNALTGAQVLSSARMFATLDPKLKAVELPSRRRALLSDTVGFIRNLPHTLVTSFRATLEEVEQAEVLVHVRDAASTYGEEQKSQVERVLGELESLSKPRIDVLNKIDLLPAREREALISRAESRPPGEKLVALSARTGEGLDALLAAIDEVLRSDPVIEAELVIPQREGAALAEVEAGTIVQAREYEGNLVRLKVSGPASLIGRLRRFRR
jgi:GTPase